MSIGLLRASKTQQRKTTKKNVNMYNINHSFISRYGNPYKKTRYSYSYSHGANYNDDVYNDRFKSNEAKKKSQSNLNKGQKRNNELSKAVIRKIRNRVFYLKLMANEKTRMHGIRRGQKYLLSFFTLTISGESHLNIRETNAKLLNTMLTDLRRNVGMKNYVWRLEFQKNGKVHYHILTDASINYKYLRHVWNRIQIEYGIMQSFTEKFSKMTFSDYKAHMITNYGKKIDHSKLAQWYAKGCREKWENPNSVDVREVSDDKEISYYISKYMSKDKPRENGLFPTLTIDTGRIWGSSAELAKTADISHHLQDVAELAFWISKEHGNQELIEEQFYSYILVDWRLIFVIMPDIRTQLRKRVQKYCNYEIFEPPRLGIFALD